MNINDPSGGGRLREAIGVGFIGTFGAALMPGGCAMLLDRVFRLDLLRLQPWLAVGVWCLAACVGVAAGMRSWRASGRRTERLRRFFCLCPNCCYDLTGNESGLCPECGKVVT